MTVVATRSLAICAALLGGVVAGFSINRAALVDLPAWAMLGPDQWVRFTRAADLGTGLVLYPAEGLLALVCSVGAAFLVHFDRAKAAVLPLHIAAVTAMAAFIVTRFVIAPHILKLRGDSTDVAYVQSAFGCIRRWWGLKAGLHLLTFVCNVWGLMTLMRP